MIVGGWRSDIVRITAGGISWAQRRESGCTVSKVCVNSFSVSLDGYGAGPDQSESNPLGVGGSALHEWIFATKTGRKMIGETGGSEGADDAIFKRNLESDGPVIMGRNMFGPVRGPWESLEWRGWWGDEPPFHRPVFVLTHYERPDLVLGETTFHFVTGGMDEALARARDVAGEHDIRVGGGVSTIRTLLDSQTVDELRLTVVPVRLGGGERLLESVRICPLGYELRNEVVGEGATHLELSRSELAPL
jgi:dihydrofolate reductase